MDLDMDMDMDSGMSCRELAASEIPDKRAKLEAWMERRNVLSAEHNKAYEELGYYEQLKNNYKSMCDEDDPESAQGLQSYIDELKMIQDRLDELYKEILEARGEVDFLAAELKEMEEDAKG
ncbi:hypothetical protein J3459_015917 [Metarhizium acridum]|uniref:uncharacterized protein n=1 Tax=Metarhizium acridum TaxID=92637 RepID=UPI001C6CCEB1|nr:hypothetical protein J3458_021349 [Metarhizium acridum]KAG8412542.1 hypothetical protein J3459_015917 [Metarhizium acridum]